MVSRVASTVEPHGRAPEIRPTGVADQLTLTVGVTVPISAPSTTLAVRRNGTGRGVQVTLVGVVRPWKVTWSPLTMAQISLTTTPR